jgi:hypothetical protein
MENLHGSALPVIRRTLESEYIAKQATLTKIIMVYWIAKLFLYYTQNNFEKDRMGGGAHMRQRKVDIKRG